MFDNLEAFHEDSEHPETDGTIDTRMNIQEIVIWVQEENQHCPFPSDLFTGEACLSDPSDCEDIQNKAKEIGDYIKSLCAEEELTARKMAFILRKAAFWIESE